MVRVQQNDAILRLLEQILKLSQTGSLGRLRLTQQTILTPSGPQAQENQPGRQQSEQAEQPTTQQPGLVPGRSQQFLGVLLDDQHPGRILDRLGGDGNRNASVVGPLDHPRLAQNRLHARHIGVGQRLLHFQGRRSPVTQIADQHHPVTLSTQEIGFSGAGRQW